MDQTFVIASVIAANTVVAFYLIFLVRRGSPAGAAGAAAEARLREVEAELMKVRQEKSEAETKHAVEKQKAERIPILEASIQEKEKALEDWRGKSTSAERDLATAREKATQKGEALDRALGEVEELKKKLASATDRNELLSAEKGKLETELGRVATQLEEKVESAETLRRDMEKERGELKLAQAALAELRSDDAKLRETLEQEMKQAGEKLALLKDAREQMSHQFRILAEDVMKTHGETFTKQNKDQLDGLLTPLRDKLTEFQQGLLTAQTESTKERATLAEQIRSLTDTSKAMSQETQNLTRALKGKAQTQGAWGEMILATILERSGLRRGEEYITQESHSSEDGSRLRSDVIIKLPNSERLIVDSKVSLTAFNDYVNGQDDAERATAMTRHLVSLRGHIKTLAGKEYQQVAGNSVDFVVMFVPIEGALAAALQEDPSLTAFAAEHHVAIATPTTLMMALRTVGSLWQIERRNQNAEAIAKRAGLLYDKFHGFVGDMQKLGSRLKQAGESYDDAMGKLSLGRGNLVGQIEQLKGMGAKTAKALPAELLGDEEPLALPVPVTAED